MLALKMDAQEARVAFWQRLLRDQAVEIREIDHQLLPLVRASASEERRAYVVLRAAADLMSNGSEATRRTLRGTLMYWFSNTGSGDDRDCAIDDYTDLRALIGRRLSWGECIRQVGGNPDAYSARSRLVDLLQTSIRQHWTDLFGEEMQAPGDADA